MPEGAEPIASAADAAYHAAAVGPSALSRGSRRGVVMLIGLNWGSLVSKIFAWAFVPTAAVLAAVALISMQAYQRLAMDLVIDRDVELTRLHAEGIHAGLSDAANHLRQEVGETAVGSREPSDDEFDAGVSAESLAKFDAGLAFIGTDGTVVWTRPAGLVPPGTAWSVVGPTGPAGTGRAVWVSDVFSMPGTGQPVVAVQASSAGGPDAPPGTLVGLMRIGGAGTEGEGLGSLMPEVWSRDAILVDSGGSVILGPERAVRQASPDSSPAVARAAAGETGSWVGRSGSGPEVLATFAPVPGTSWSLIEEQPWSAIAAPARRFGRLLLALLAAGLAVPALVVLFGARRLTRPINDLIHASQEVAEGRFGYTIEAHTGDEIEELVRQFNAMSSQLESSVRDLERRVSDRTAELAERSAAERRRADQFRVIAEVGRRMTTIKPVDELLEQIALLVQQAFGYDHVGIGLVEGEHVVYQAGAGPIWEGAKPPFKPARLAVGRQGISGWVAASGEPLLVDDVKGEPRYVDLEGSRAQSELAVPIIAQGKVIGVLDAQSRRSAAFDSSDVTVMQSLANQAAIAIENARLYARARTAAALEERQRVARDLHDSVTQSLYGVSLYGDAAARMIEAADIDGATELLAQLRLTAKEALQEMRLLIFELRPAELERMGLVGALQSRLDAVEARSGLNVVFDADESVRLPLATEEALYRIAQEALNNALRHARATTVAVTLRRAEDTVDLEIADDGDGFDVVQAKESGGVGLHSMAERAVQVGAQLAIESRIGAGARVRVEVTQ